MDKKIIAGGILAILLVVAIIAIIPRVGAQQFGAQETDMERLEKALSMKLDTISKNLDDIQRTLTFIRRKVDDIDRKIK